MLVFSNGGNLECFAVRNLCFKLARCGKTKASSGRIRVFVYRQIGSSLCKSYHKLFSGVTMFLSS